jgi:uncharacterized membrane protein
VSTSRLETFADGVFAIAATLLVLDVHAGPPLSDTLLRIWPSYVAYAVSFATIGIIWMNHHYVFSLIARVDRTFLLINVGFLMCVGFIPFPTGLVATHFRGPGLPPAALTYGATLIVTALLFNLLWFYAARRRRLLRPDADLRAVSGVSRSYAIGPVVYAVATVTAFADATAAVILFALITCFYVVESSVFGRSRARPEDQPASE